MEIDFKEMLQASFETASSELSYQVKPGQYEGHQGHVVTGLLNLPYNDKNIKAQLSVFVPDDSPERAKNITIEHLKGFLETELTWLKSLNDSDKELLIDAGDLTAQRRANIMKRVPYPEMPLSTNVAAEEPIPEDKEILRETEALEASLPTPIDFIKEKEKKQNGRN